MALRCASGLDGPLRWRFRFGVALRWRFRLVAFFVAGMTPCAMLRLWISPDGKILATGGRDGIRVGTWPRQYCCTISTKAKSLLLTYRPYLHPGWQDPGRDGVGFGKD